MNCDTSHTGLAIPCWIKWHLTDTWHDSCLTPCWWYAVYVQYFTMVWQLLPRETHAWCCVCFPGISIRICTASCLVTLVSRILAVHLTLPQGIHKTKCHVSCKVDGVIKSNRLITDWQLLYASVTLAMQYWIVSLLPCTVEVTGSVTCSCHKCYCSNNYNTHVTYAAPTPPHTSYYSSP